MKYNFDLSRSELETLIDQWIMKKRDRDILKSRLLDGLTYEAIAEQYELSDRHVKRIVYKAEDRLFNHK